MRSSSSAPVARATAFVGAFLLVGASAAVGVFYGFELGQHHNIWLAFIFSGAALGGELIKPLAVASAIDAFRERLWTLGTAAAALSTVCIAYSVLGGLSLAAGARGDLAAERRQGIEAVDSARGQRQRAEAELANLSPARPAAELSAMIAKLKATPGANGCTGEPDGPISRKACGQALELQAEAARADRRAELERIIAAATVPPAAGNVKGDADPAATAIAAYASALGIPAKAEAIAPWLVLVAIAFLEVGSALAFVVARGFGRPRAPVEEARVIPMAPEQPGPLPRLAPPTAGDADPLIAKLRAAGGSVVGSQRELARKLGLPKSTVHKALHQLAQAGQVRLDTSPAGTTITLQ